MFSYFLSYDSSKSIPPGSVLNLITSVSPIGYQTLLLLLHLLDDNKSEKDTIYILLRSIKGGVVEEFLDIYPSRFDTQFEFIINLAY